MRQSITQLSLLSRGRNIEGVRRLEQEQEYLSSSVEQEQRKLLIELNHLEEEITQIERERMVQAVLITNQRISQ